MVGQTISHYRITEKLAEGGKAVVSHSNTSEDLQGDGPVQCDVGRLVLFSLAKAFWINPASRQKLRLTRP